MQNKPETPQSPENLSLLLVSRGIQSCVTAGIDETLPDPGVEAVADELRQSLREGCAAPDMNSLMALQAHALNALFGRSLVGATRRGYVNLDTAAIALQAQRQCRQTVEMMRLLAGGKNGERTVKPQGENA